MADRVVGGGTFGASAGAGVVGTSLVWRGVDNKGEAIRATRTKKRLNNIDDEQTLGHERFFYRLSGGYQKKGYVGKVHTSYTVCWKANPWLRRQQAVIADVGQLLDLCVESVRIPHRRSLGIFIALCV